MKKVLYVIYGVFFSFVIGYGIYAVRTFDGAVENSYTKGMDYPRQLARLQELGWQFDVPNCSLHAGSEGQLIMEIHDQEGNPISGGAVTMALSRPASSEKLPILQAKELDKGSYSSLVTIPGHGYWQVDANVRLNNDNLEHEFRIYVEKEGNTNGT